ncbi:PREDICTED: fibromodulin [Chrysochloris asiatica]|uniref:Fibromodulin n=1 Tax=Chrysochloris asiatica TaxID=185453 RepID=A0A9B0SZX9_CHRAS|nr:PREDICTED: fibromodulin [Chrysochloris asiatica]
MQWASLLLLAGLCSFSQAQYDEDPHWWFHYLRSQQSTYYDPYDPYEPYEPYPYGVEEGPAYAYGSPSPPEPRDCPQECDCPPNFPTAMYCDNRKLKYLPFVPSRMKYVYFQNNQITSIQESVFDNATGLLWIALHGNQITSDKVGKKVFSKLKHLERLYLDHNNLTRMPGPLPRSLKELHLEHNQISRVPSNALEGLENLTALYLQHNEIQEVGSAMKGLQSLILLDLSYNHLRKVPDGLPSALEQLYLEHNNVYSVPDSYFRSSPKLLYVRLSHNSLTNSGLASNTFNASSLLELDLSYNQLQKIPPVSTNLENLYLQGNKINEFSISSFCTVVDVMNFSKLQVLRLDGNEIQRSAMPVDAPLCLRLASLIEI